MYEIHLGRLKDVIKLEPIGFQERFAILLTDRFGEKWLDKTEYKNTVYLLDSEKEAQDYCQDMMDMVREKEKIKDISVNDINIWEG